MAAQSVREMEEPNSGTLDLVFPVTRKAGTGIVGNIQVRTTFSNQQLPFSPYIICLYIDLGYQ